MDTGKALRIRGTGAALMVPALAVGLAATFMPVYLEAQGADLPAENLAASRAIAAGFVAVLALVGGFLSGRVIEVRGDRLHYRSWLGLRQWPVATLTDVTYEDDIFPELVDNGPFQWLTYLRLWCGTKQILQFNYLFWRRKDLARLVGELVQRQARLRIGPRARAYLGRDRTGHA